MGICGARTAKTMPLLCLCPAGKRGEERVSAEGGFCKGWQSLSEDPSDLACKRLGHLPLDKGGS